MKEYKFDVKMYAYVRVRAPDLKSAEESLTAAMDKAELSISILDENGTAKQTTEPVYVDDIEFPYLTEVDGIPIEDIEADGSEGEELAP